MSTERPGTEFLTWRRPARARRAKAQRLEEPQKVLEPCGLEEESAAEKQARRLNVGAGPCLVWEETRSR